MKIKTLIFSILITFLPISSYSFEITNYSYSITGIFHDVTVAFKDLDMSGRVRCIILKDGKPVGMKTDFITGVGTIQIMLSGGIIDTSARCNKVK